MNGGWNLHSDQWTDVYPLISDSFLLRFLLHNKQVFWFAHSMWLCEVSFCTLTLDIVLEYLEYLIKMSLAHLYRFSYFPYPSMGISSMIYSSYSSIFSSTYSDLSLALDWELLSNMGLLHTLHTRVHNQHTLRHYQTSSAYPLPEYNIWVLKSILSAYLSYVVHTTWTPSMIRMTFVGVFGSLYLKAN